MEIDNVYLCSFFKFIIAKKTTLEAVNDEGLKDQLEKPI